MLPYCWLQPVGADSRRCRRFVCSSYIPTSTYSQTGSVPARSSVPVEGHAENTWQRTNVLGASCAFHFYIQVWFFCFFCYFPCVVNNGCVIYLFICLLEHAVVKVRGARAGSAPPAVGWAPPPLLKFQPWLPKTWPGLHCMRAVVLFVFCYQNISSQ